MAAGRPLLPLRLRKLIGTLILVPYIIIYALLVMNLAVHLLADAPTWAALLFFLVGGVVWLPPAMVLIWWMSRP